MESIRTPGALMKEPSWRAALSQLCHPRSGSWRKPLKPRQIRVYSGFHFDRQYAKPTWLHILYVELFEAQCLVLLMSSRSIKHSVTIKSASFKISSSSGAVLQFPAFNTQRLKTKILCMRSLVQAVLSDLVNRNDREIHVNFRASWSTCTIIRSN